MVESKLMNKKKTRNKYINGSGMNVLKRIFIDYIWKIKHSKIILFPTLLAMIISKWLEVVMSELMQKIAEKLKLQYDTDFNSILMLFFIVTIASSILVELPGLLFLPPTSRAFRLEALNTFNQFFSLDYSTYHNSYGMGEIHSTIERKSAAVVDILDVIVLNILSILFFVGFALWRIYAVLGPYTALILAGSLLFYALSTFIISHYRLQLKKDYNEMHNISSNQIHDSFSSYELIKAFGSEEEETRKFNKAQIGFEKSTNTLWRSFYYLNCLQKLIIGLQTYVIIYAGIKGLMNEKLTSDTLVFYLGVNGSMCLNLYKLGHLYGKFTQSMINIKIMVLEPEENEEAITIRCFRDSLYYKNVMIQHKDRIILKNINLNVKKGEKIAIIGENGIGKSTLLKCLLKFINYEGSIAIDDLELKDLSSNSIRSLISYIPQNSLLFNETVRYNLTYGNRNISEQEMIRTCKAFDIHNSIMRLEQGYDTVVGTGGQNLSGGERQKISFIRAILKRGEIFILDEPTANLDKKSERNLVKQILKNISEENKTILMVVHSLNLLKVFDKIFYIEKDGSKIVSYDDAIELMSHNEKRIKHNE